MPTAYPVIAGLLVLGFAGAAQLLFPQGAQGAASWLAQFCTFIVRL